MKLQRHGIILTCGEDFMTSRELSQNEIAAQRLKEWEKKFDAFWQLENDRKAREMSLAVGKST